MARLLLVFAITCVAYATCVSALNHTSSSDKSKDKTARLSSPKARSSYGNSNGNEDNNNANDAEHTGTQNYQVRTEYDSSDLSEQNNANQLRENLTTLMDIKFVQDFAQFDPRSNASKFMFFQTYVPLNLLSDGALFLPGDYGVLNAISKPMDHWLPQSYGPAAVLQSYDMLAETKLPLPLIENGQILAVELHFNCETFNVEKNPFPAGSILNVKDDPRLGTCGFSVLDLDLTGIDFGFYLTNTGMWIKYRRGARARSVLQNYDAFEIFRPAGKRANTKDIVKARIEIDRALNETRWIVNGKLVYTVGRFGVLSNSLFDGVTRLVGFSPGSPPVGAAQLPITPGRFSILLNNIKKLDDADPNGPPTRVPNNSPNEFTVDAAQYSPGLVRFSNTTGFYDPQMTFVDNVSLRFNCIWGQGVVSGLASLLAETYTAPRSQSEAGAQSSSSSTSQSANSFGNYANNDEGSNNTGGQANAQQQPQLSYRKNLEVEHKRL